MRLKEMRDVLRDAVPKLRVSPIPVPNSSPPSLAAQESKGALLDALNGSPDEKRANAEYLAEIRKGIVRFSQLVDKGGAMALPENTASSALNSEARLATQTLKQLSSGEPVAGLLGDGEPSADLAKTKPTGA